MAHRLILGALVVLLGWGFLRQGQLNRLRQQVAEEESNNRRFLATLSTAAQDNEPLPPNPRTDTTAWLSANVFKGSLDKHIIANEQTKDGSGADVKLRGLEPKHVLHLLDKMTRVNLVVRLLTLEDLGSRSVWEVHLIVETPKQEAAQ